MDLSRRSRLPPLIVFIIILCVHMSQARFYGDRQKRQNGANMYLPASSIIPEGEGNDPNEWTEWSSPSECSRSCGGGVSYQTRECLRTGPDGSPMCTGGNRKYFSCNTQDCPEEEPEFRAQQCSRFNHVPFDGIYYDWVPYTNAPNPCELNCMPKGERFYYRHKAKVIDGTRCNDRDLNVCVDGQCQPVGCDMMLGSGAKEDSCRKCGGDGTTCRTIADRFTTNNLATGYNDLLLIPSGATNIRVEETAPSNNYLACRNLSSHYYLNGNWRIDFPRPMLFAGSWWTYQRKPNGFAAPDQLTCRGPITESIYIVMLVQDKNVSIDYEYSIPQSVSSSTPDVYTWTHMEYEPCSASCGGGTQTRTVTCNNRLNLEEVDASFCDERAKPAESQECGTEPCAPHWVTSDWDKCSKGCGSDGIQNRTVSCERISPSGEHTMEDDAICLQQVGNKPANQQECNRDVKNCPKYHLGPWSPCDKLCGEGKQNRKVTCYIEENGRKKVLSDEDCVEEKPETEMTCMLAPCEGVDWIISQWSGCDACGQNTETRTAICGSKSGKIYPDEFCAPEVPLLSRPCESKKCKTQWFTSEWSKCSSACGKGAQSRIVLCGEFDGNTVTKVTDESQCDAATKPEGSQECEGEEKECPGQWFTGPWGSCSKSCGGGERQREVLCLANGTKSSNCDENKIESLSEKCNPQACTEDEVMPVESTDKPLSDEEEEDCEEEDDDEVKLVTDKMSEDLKISEGIELDDDTTLSTLITDELMMSDSTPPTDTTDEGASTELPLTTVEGSGDDTESTDMSSIATEGSGDTDTTSESSETGQTTESSDVSGGTGSDSTDASLSTDASASTDSSSAIDSSTDVPASTGASSTTDASDSTDSSTESSGPTGASASTESSESTDASASTDTSTSTDLSNTTDSSDATDGSTDTSVSTDSSGSTDAAASTESPGSTAATDSTGSTDVSGSTGATDSSESTGSTDLSGSTGPTDSTESTGSTDVSGSTVSSGPTESPQTTDSSESTDATGTTEETSSATGSSVSTVSSSTDTTTDSTASTDSSTSDSTESSVSTESTTESSTESSVSTDSTPDVTTESSVSTDGITESSVSTDASASTDITGTTDASASTDITGTTDASASTDITGTTDASASTDITDTTDTSSSTDITATTDASASTDITATSDDSTTNGASASTDSSASDTTDPSASTDVSASTAASDSTYITTESGSTDVSTESSGSTGSSDSTDATKSSSDESSVTSSDISTESTVSGSTNSESSVITESTSDSGISVTTESGSSSSTDVEGSTTDVSGQTSSDQTTDVSGSDATTESGSGDTTLESGVTDETTDTSGTATTASDGLSTSSDVFDSTTESSGDTSLSTDEFTTVDIWTTDDDELEKTTPNTLESVISKESKPKKCKGKKPKDCKKTEHGCCPDGKHIAKGPFDEGCPIPKTCADTEFGCCHDGVSPAEDKNFKGCPKSQCAETLFGCCPDKFTPAEGEDNEGCPEPTTVPPTTTTELPEDESTMEGESSEMPETTEAPVPPGAVPSCSFGEFGCCPDGTTTATGENFEGCNIPAASAPVPTDCRSSEFGCCYDGRTPASGPNNQGCASCTFETYGCCPDNETPAHGPLGEGCCLSSPYGCCPDNINSARGPNFQDCDCQYAPYGCCPDKKSAARGPSNEGCGCETSQFGCCPDKLTPAQGPKFEGCACHTLQFGCCPDGVTVAQGPHHYGCHCSQTEHKCCPDEKTAAKGPNFEGCTCLESKYGCCPDGVSSAQGDKFEGCENVKEPPQKACGLPKETGPCGNFSIKYFFDTSYGACAKFWYGGCEGNGNRFDSESECKDTCQDYTGKEACFLPKSSGPCTGHISKWYFDTDRGRCEEFKYGGCFGTNNRFDSKEECQSLCSVSETTPPCDQPMDEGPCEGNFERWFYENQTDVCRPFRYGGCKGNKNNYPTENACNYHCRQPGVHKDYCSLPKQTGDCSEKHARWHYSETDKKCMPFYYTGCGGNKNSFPSLESCEDHCPKEVAKDICEIPAEVGECTNYEPMWYYDTKDQDCRQFYYGGCGGNENKFATKEGCLQRCEKIPEPEPETQPQPEPQPQQPAASTNVCEEKQEQGPCANYSLLWAYNKERGACSQFYYGGCEGNGNRFNSEEECAHQCIREEPREPEQEKPKPQAQPQEVPRPVEPEQPEDENVCLLAQDMGDCDNYVPMWYFDSQESRCAMFYYGGCGGNGNRFASEEECSSRCLSDNAPEDVGNRFDGSEIDASPEVEPSPDVDTIPETDDSRKCFLPAAPGNCLENEPRWYYNSADGLCDQFMYTGCEGNANNYATETQCEDECFPVHETCKLPALSGNCNETVIRWHYSESEGRCNEFEFTGCRGNRNNFVTEQECMSRCGSGEPPAPTYSVCDLALEAGECENTTTAWHYDSESAMCVAFTYTGCGGNGNRFQSKEQCERQCGEFKGVDVCNEEVSSGPCRQWQTRFYFNKDTRTCEPFTYGGCQGTGNRFENRGECESLCLIGQEPTYSDTRDICKQQVDVGRCNGNSVNERRWYYDDARGNCVSFIYSGCAGNQNNFRSYESCYNYCSKPEITNNEVLPTNSCEEFENECRSLSCPYGTERIPVDEKCERCECTNPCGQYSCPEGEQCAVEVSGERSGEFVPVCRPTNKPGTCPQLTANDGACGRECYTDADCRGDNKCCSNGCGFVCVHPQVPTMPTTAPTTPAPVVVYPGEVKVTLVPKQKPELDVRTPMGGIAVLRCFATGNPAPNVTWSRSNVVVDTNQGRYVLTSSGDLTIVQVRQTDSGSYVCVASNGLGEPVRREVELQVTDPVNLPAYVYGDKNFTQIVTLNRPAVVRCPAGGHPAPMVHWWRNRSRLPLVSNRIELARDYSLTFRSVQLSDLGPYTCEAWNRLSTRPATIKVTLVAVGPARATTNEDAQYLQYIVEPPRAPVTQRPSYPYRPTRPPAVPPPYVVVPAVPVNAVIGMDPGNNYAPGSTVAFSCSVQGYPMPNVTWIKDGLPLVPSERVQISVGAPYRVIINNVSTADTGRYGCKAANSVSYSISDEMVTIQSTIPLNPECINNDHFANCNLIVKGRYCKNKYYAKFCCRSCALAGQL